MRSPRPTTAGFFVMEYYNQKLQDLTKKLGYDDVEQMTIEHLSAVTVPAICIKKDCNFTTEVEFDQEFAWCDECNEPTAHSVYVLLEGVR